MAMRFENRNGMDYFEEMREDEDRRKPRENETMYRNRENETMRRTRESGSEHRMCRGVIHVVKEGDTLYKIAQTYHVEVSELMYENPYVNIYQLQPGDEICVPVAERV